MDSAHHQKNELAAEHSEGVSLAAKENNGTSVPLSEQSYQHGIAPIEDKQLPKGYYYSLPLLGTFFAVALGLTCGAGVFAMVAPNLGVINAEIGPSANITWVAIVYILMLGTGSLLVGRLTDIFGRRWFFVGGSFLAVIGNIVCSRAQNIPTMIGGMTMIGAAAASQTSFVFVVGELVPMRWRFLASGGVYLLGTPFNIFGAKIGPVIQHNLGWRWIYYIMIILNGVCCICWFLFYHPPTFNMLQHGQSRKRLILDFDYVGFVLFSAGLTLVMLGLSWGGQLYEWTSAHVICTIVIGGVSLIAFVAYEVIVQPKEPYIPMKLFRRRGYNAAVTALGVVAMGYYGFSIIWPTMAATLYPASSSTNGWMNLAASGLFTFGDLVGLLIGSFIRRLRNFMLGCLIIGTAFAGAVAVGTQHNMDTTVSVMALGCFFLGVVESQVQTLAGIAIDDQNDIGAAVGFSSSARSFGGALATTIYSTILANRLKTTIPELVPPAVVQAGLPPTSIPALLQFFQGLLPADKVPGLTPDIAGLGLDAYQTANSQAYKTCFLSSIAFCGLGLIAVWFCDDLDPKSDHIVAKELHYWGDEKRLNLESERKQAEGQV